MVKYLKSLQYALYKAKIMPDIFTIHNLPPSETVHTEHDLTFLDQLADKLL